MLRKGGMLLAAFLLPALLLPGAALAWHTSSAAIDDVRYVNDAGGVTFYVDFRIWDHFGYPGAVRILISNGVDTVVAVRYFHPAYSAASYRDFPIFISNLRLLTEGDFFLRPLHVSVEILDASGSVLTRSAGVLIWALGAL